MKAIIKGKLYDTEQAEHIPFMDIPFNFLDNQNGFIETNLYKTTKGNWFCTVTTHDNQQVQELTEEDVKVLLKHDVDEYIKHFGEPETA